MSTNPSPGFSADNTSRRDLVVGRSRVTTFLEAANSDDPRERAIIRDRILNRPGDLPFDFLDEAAGSAKYASIAQALLSAVSRLSYSARKSLAQKFEKVGRDEAVLWCLADSTSHDAEGLRLLCEASLRGRFIGKRDVDLEPSLFAASFGDTRAEVRWIQLYSAQKKRGGDLDRSIQRLVALAHRGHDPHAFQALGEMLMSNQLRVGDPDYTGRCFQIAAHFGHSPAKLSMIQHFPQHESVDVNRYLVDFYNDSYFPGLSWCYELQRSEEAPLRHIDAILKSYLWHPDLPISTPEQISEAVRSAEELPAADRASVAQWALRNNLLIMDERYPAVRTV